MAKRVPKPILLACRGWEVSDGCIRRHRRSNASNLHPPRRIHRQRRRALP
jgi:hypothetical protein